MNEQRWVWLTYYGERFVIDSNQVSGVRPTSTGGRAAGAPANDPIVHIGMKGTEWSKSADGTMEDVCAKLGIPLEGE